MPKTDPQLQPASDFPNGLSQPALRALASAGIQQLEELTKFKEAEIKKLHGIGPNALAKLRLAMAARGLSFAGDTSAGVDRKGPVAWIN